MSNLLDLHPDDLVLAGVTPEDLLSALRTIHRLTGRQRISVDYMLIEWSSEAMAGNKDMARIRTLQRACRRAISKTKGRRVRNFAARWQAVFDMLEAMSYHSNRINT